MPLPASLVPSARTLRSLAIAGCAAAALAAEAGMFSVTPVRIFMTPRDRAVAVTLVNEGDTEVALQADINTWMQKPDGADELVLTEDMILSPPIIRLAPKSRQVVRLALVKPADASRQLTYRMIISEIPEATAPKGATVEVQVALALSMPVFITPPQARREMACTAAATPAPGAELRCSNSGSAYAQVREATLTRGDKVLARFEGGAYILPGATRVLAAKGDAAVGAGPAKLTVGFDDGKSQVFDLVLP
jgi:fimbrial chaperone protein